MKFSEFVKNECQGCGGNWSVMLLTGIKNKFSEVFAKMNNNKSYNFWELCDILERECGIIFE